MQKIRRNRKPEKMDSIEVEIKNWKRTQLLNMKKVRKFGCKKKKPKTLEKVGIECRGTRKTLGNKEKE